MYHLQYKDLYLDFITDRAPKKSLSPEWQYSCNKQHTKNHAQSVTGEKKASQGDITWQKALNVQKEHNIQKNIQTDKKR